uniref:Uncharacterized protein n=1 Tax=Desertifilum tharense IPPAS B-1220 TaxID=1781255 RepID=A0A1E5QGK3_9CYAN|nr:hypothetical protein BH720_18245 [Desertifilum tharense IPPAS B-1220]
MIGTRLLTLRSLDQNYSRDGKKGVGNWELGVGEEGSWGLGKKGVGGWGRRGWGDGEVGGIGSL